MSNYAFGLCEAAHKISAFNIDCSYANSIVILSVSRVEWVMPLVRSTQFLHKTQEAGAR